MGFFETIENSTENLEAGQFARILRLVMPAKLSQLRTVFVLFVLSHQNATDEEVEQGAQIAYAHRLHTD